MTCDTQSKSMLCHNVSLKASSPAQVAQSWAFLHENRKCTSSTNCSFLQHQGGGCRPHQHCRRPPQPPGKLKCSWVPVTQWLPQRQQDTPHPKPCLHKPLLWLPKYEKDFQNHCSRQNTRAVSLCPALSQTSVNNSSCIASWWPWTRIQLLHNCTTQSAPRSFSSSPLCYGYLGNLGEITFLKSL